MKIELQYGLLITLGVVLWTVTAHLLVPNHCSAVHMFGPLVFFNLLELVGIYLGASAKKRASSGKLKFKAGLKTGIGIALVYGLCSCVFFLLFVAVLGSGVMCAEPGAATLPFWKLVVFAFVGQFGGALILGLIYSTIVAFILAEKRRPLGRFPN